MQKRTKTHKKREKKPVEIAKENCWNVFVHQNQIDLPLCNRACLNRGGGCNFAPPPDFGRTINCIPFRGADYARTTCPFPQFSNLPSALCKTFTNVNVFDIEMRLQLRLHAADCLVVCLKSQLSAIYTEFTYLRDLHNWKKILLRHSTNLKQRYVGPE